MHQPFPEFLDKLFLILANGGIVLGIFVILLLNNKGVRKSRANTFLSILLGALTFSVFHLLYAGHVISHLPFRAYSLGYPTFLLIAPLLWFYIVEITGTRVKWRAAFFHFIPFFIIVFCSVTFRSFRGDIPLIRLLDSHPRLPFIIFWISFAIQFSCYQLLIHRKWRDYQLLIRQEVSNTEDVNISWVRFFMAVFLIVNISFLFSLFAVIHLDIMNWVWKSVGVIFSLSIFALGYKGILQKEVFFSDLNTPAATPPQPQVNKPLKPDQAIIDALLQFMRDKKPFLDSELSLSSLSKQTGMNRNQLSQLINEGMGENFYDFINKYRVDEVKRLMADPKKSNYNLLGLALEAGFKSKSTFNLVFKRFTGLTPTAYRKNSTQPDVQ